MPLVTFAVWLMLMVFRTVTASPVLMNLCERPAETVLNDHMVQSLNFLVSPSPFLGGLGKNKYAPAPGHKQGQVEKFL